jgi:hypothetical protein
MTGGEPPSADVLGPLVHLPGDARDAADGVGRELEGHALGGEQQRVLLDQARVRLREDGLEILDRERSELDADREPTLELGNEVARLGQMERAGGDEEDVVRLHRAVLRADRRALHQRQQVALHALPRDVGAVRVRPGHDLVDLVDEDDAVLLCVGESGRLHVLVDHELRRLLVGEQLERLGDRHLARFFLAAAQLREHAAELLGHLLHAGGADHLHGRAGLGDLDLDLLAGERPFAQALAHHLAGGGVGRRRGDAELGARRRHQDVEHALLGGLLARARAPHRPARALP